MKLKISEQDFLNSVVELAHLMHWRVHHSRPAWTEKGYRTAIQGDAGFPDLFLARKPRIVIAEIKSDKGRISEAQSEWLLELKQCFGIELYLWRPDDWLEIQHILQ
jgi:hypothetical protein